MVGITLSSILVWMPAPEAQANLAFVDDNNGV